MKSTETLKHEHVVIRQALAVLGALAGRVESGDPPPEADLAGLLEFFTVFADGCHHVKEETILFPALEAAGLPKERGPLAAMLEQHDQGRRLVGILRGELPALSRDPAARRRFAAAARDYLSLLDRHIEIENEVLFPGADALLPAGSDAEIAAAFDRHEALEMGPDVHRAFHRRLDDLTRRYLTSEVRHAS